MACVYGRTLLYVHKIQNHKPKRIKALILNLEERQRQNCEILLDLRIFVCLLPMQ